MNDLRLRRMNCACGTLRSRVCPAVTGVFPRRDGFNLTGSLLIISGGKPGGFGVSLILRSDGVPTKPAVLFFSFSRKTENVRLRRTGPLLL